ncbi:MAG: transporter substrate-binding domain-containing protein [Marinobacter sp.]|nr:transporter substrate-binding domain-containing protein [Marinobacter sp.]
MVSPVATPSAHADKEIVVGVYDFPPVAQITENRKVEGLVGDLLEELETLHPDIDFRIFHTSPKRRYLDFDAHLYDVIFFESPSWEWQDKQALISPPLLMDEDLYIALNKPGRDASFFDDLEQRNIVALSGYHYGFAGLETNPQEMERRFSIEFSDSHQRNLNLIKADRPSVAQVAIINESYLQMHLDQHPEDRDLFLISEQPDQTYQLSIITHPEGPVTARDMMNLLTPLIETGRYQSLVRKWGLGLPPSLLPALPDN